MLTQTVLIRSKKASLTISASVKRRKVILAGTGSFSPEQLPDLFRVLRDFAASVGRTPRIKRAVKAVKRHQRKATMVVTKQVAAPLTERPTKSRRLRGLNQDQEALPLL